MTGFPNKEERYFAPCLTSIFGICIGAPICTVRPLGLGDADSDNSESDHNHHGYFVEQNMFPVSQALSGELAQPLKLPKVAVPSVKDL